MLFAAVGAVLFLLWVLEIAPVSEWSWWIVFAPFALAVLWWTWADKSGWTQRKAMQRMEDKKDARRERSLDALGQGDPSKRRKR